MPKIKITGHTEIEVPADKRLVSAIEEAGVHIGHRCGGIARCTTCRVIFSHGEPENYSKAEYERLHAANLLDDKYRLSCQILCDHDMEVEPLMTKENQGWEDTGPAVKPYVTPEPEYHPKAYFEKKA